jgi:hypothetical protein
MSKMADLLREIEDRLREIEEERADLLRMRERYAGLVPVDAAPARTNGSNASGAPGGMDGLGISDAIRRVLGEAGTRGLQTREMVDRVLKIASTNASNPRRSVESTAYNMRKAGNLDFRDGRYYLQATLL